MATDISAVEQTIKAILSPDNEARKAAEVNLRALTHGCPRSTIAFAGVLEQSADDGVRLFAATQLRKKISKGYVAIAKTNAAEAERLREFLLERATTDPDRRVRSNISGVISALAAAIIPSPGWPALVPWIGAACHNTDPTVRVVGFTTFGMVAPSVRGAFISVLSETVTLLRSGIHDTTPAVAAASMLALSNILNEIEDDDSVMKALAVLVPDLTSLLQRMLDVAQQSPVASSPAGALATGGFAATAAAAAAAATAPVALGWAQSGGSGVDSDLFLKTLEALDSLVQFQRKAIKQSVPTIAAALCQVVTRKDLPMSVRDMAVTTLNDLVVEHPRAFMAASAAPLLESVFNASLELLAEAASCEDDSDDEEADEDDQRLKAIMLGDELMTGVCQLPMQPADLYAPVRALACRVLGDPESGAQEAPASATPALACGVLGALTACLGPLREHLVGEIGWSAADGGSTEVKCILVWAARALQMQDVNVVGQACLLLAQSAEYLQPHVFEHGDAFVSMVKGVIQVVTTPVAGARVLSRLRRITLDKALVALEKFCEDCEPEHLAPHLEALVPVLSRVVVGELALSTQGAKSVIVSALQTLAAICTTARTRLRDRTFALPILSAAMRYFNVSDDALLTLRAHSVDLLGAFINAIGVATFVELSGGDVNAVSPTSPAGPATAADIGGGGASALDGDVRRIPVIEQLMQQLQEGLKHDYMELTECTIRCWSNLAEVLGGSFIVYLEPCGDVLMQVLACADFIDSDSDSEGATDSDDGVLAADGITRGGNADAKANAGLSLTLDGRTKDAKVAALHALGVFARTCREALIVRGNHIDFVNAFNEHVSAAIANVDDDVANTAVTTLVAFVVLVAAVPDGGTAPKGLFLGHPAASLPEVSSGFGKAADAATAQAHAAWGFAPRAAAGEAAALPAGVAAHVVAVDRCPKWQVGRPEGEDVFDQEVRDYIDTVLTSILTLVHSHSTRSVVEQALAALTELTIALGPVGVNNRMNSIVEACLKLLKGTAACQRNAEVMQQLGLNDDEDDPTCANSMTTEFTLNLIETLAKAWGPDFGAAWVELWPPFANLLSASHPNVMPAIGTLAHVVSGLRAAPGSVGAQLFDQHLQVFWVAVGEAPPEGGILSRPKGVAQNGVFGLGLLAEACTDAMVPHWDRALRATAAALSIPNAPGGLIDTAVGALCRFVAARRDLSRPEEVLPVALSHTPLKKEACEYIPVMDVITKELPNLPASLIPHVLRATAGVMTNKELELELTAPYKQAIQMFMFNRRADVAAAITTLDEEIMASLRTRFIL